jgi:hypothetical protein
LSPDFVHQVECPGNLGVDDTPDLLKTLIEKSVAESAAGISKQRINLSSVGQSPVELVDPLRVARSVSTASTAAPNSRSFCGAFDLGFVGGDQQVEAVLGTAAR